MGTKLNMNWSDLLEEIDYLKETIERKLTTDDEVSVLNKNIVDALAYVHHCDKSELKSANDKASHALSQRDKYVAKNVQHLIDRLEELKLEHARMKRAGLDVIAEEELCRQSEEYIDKEYLIDEEYPIAG